MTIKTDYVFFPQLTVQEEIAFINFWCTSSDFVLEAGLEYDKNRSGHKRDTGLPLVGVQGLKS